MSWNTYDVGDVVRVTGAFTNAAGAPTDPGAVIFKFTNPVSNITSTYTYGTDAQVVKDSTGNYHVDIDATEPGLWQYRWESTGVGKAADEGRFEVRRSMF